MVHLSLKVSRGIVISTRLRNTMIDDDARPKSPRGKNWAGLVHNVIMLVEELNAKRQILTIDLGKRKVMRHGALGATLKPNVNLHNGSLKSKRQKLCFQKSKINTMLITVYDSKRILHKEFYSDSETVNGEYYLGV
ncbi:hypothetical protein Trydic_g3912 [Trypoxylus dichotomus]